MTKKYLDSIEWVGYLEREQELTIFASFIDPYGKMLEQATGFGFKHQLYKYEGTLGVFYRDRKEIEECDKHFADLIGHKDPRIEKWIAKEDEISNIDYSLFSFTKLVMYFKEALLYNTVIPYRLLSALSFTKCRHSALREKLEKIRSRSLYPEVFSKILEKASLNLDYPEELLQLMTIEEMVPNIESKEIEQRRNHCYFYSHNGSVVFYYGNIPKLEERENLDIKELKGNVAYKGNVVGRIKIVNNPKQMLKFKKGDILVSINTNPSLMPIIEKASAIITDEGGITCHAAIVSRELNKPCIIGTKIATKVLKDGDFVEVDANKGVVRKL